MSDRDKKIIVVLLIAMILILPYVFYIKDTKVNTETVNVEIATLQARLDYLNMLENRRGDYIKETERLNGERDEIIASFPAGIAPENYTMFLLQTEYSSKMVPLEETEYYTFSAVTSGKAEDEDGQTVMQLQYPILFDNVSYAPNMATPISSEEMGTDTGYVALTNSSALTYRCYYGGVKYLLKYLMDYKDPMIYRSITMQFDSETGVMTGAIQLDQYAVAGADREFPDVNFIINVDGQKVDMGLTNNTRGNEDAQAGIFGNLELEAVEEEEVVPEDGGAEAAE